MKSKNNLIIFFILFLSFFSAYSFYLLSSDIEKTESIEFNKKNIEYIAENTDLLLSIYFMDKKAEANHYANSNFVKNLLSEELISDKTSARLSIDKISKINLKELENYLISGKNMTIDKLRNSFAFRDMLTSMVGDYGYSGVIDENSRFLFHPNSSYEGMLVQDIVETPDFSELIKNIDEYNSRIFVDYVLKNGESRIAFIEKLKIKTSDEKELYLFTSKLVNNFKIVENIPENNDYYLDKILENNLDYINISIISRDGYILYGHPEYLGFNLFVNKPEIERAINNNKDSTLIMGPMYSLDKEIIFIVFNPVYENSELLGYLAIRLDANHIYDLIDKNRFENNVFLVNSKKLLSSPYGKFSILSQEMIYPDVDWCFNQNNLSFEENVTFFNYENSYGKEMTRAYKYIEEINLCLFVESEKEFENDFSIEIKRQKTIYSSLILLFAILVLYLVLFKIKVKVLDKKIKKENTFIKFLNKFNDSNFFFVCFLFVIVLFFALNYFIPFNEINDLATEGLNLGALLFMFMILKMVVKYKNNILFVNSLFSIIISMIFFIVIHFLEIITKENIEPFIWSIPISILCFSLIFLLEGVRRLKRNVN